MMVMTAKVNPKKAIIGIALIFAVVLGLVLLLGGGKEASASPASPTSVTAATEAAEATEVPIDSRVRFLKDFGWEVRDTPKESNQVKVPEKSSTIFARYNALQLSQGYDLSDYAGKKVMRYVYEITNYPGASQPVYATLLIYKNQIIGGDITDTAVKGKIHGFKRPAELQTSPTLPDWADSTEDAAG